MKKEITKIDIEPQWNDIFRVMMKMSGETSALGKTLKECQSVFLLADEIRALQKSGAKHIDLSFDENGRIQMVTND